MTVATTSPVVRPRLSGATFLDWLLRRLDAHADRRHLHSLSDHLLSDMGIMRDQIDDILKGAMRRM